VEENIELRKLLWLNHGHFQLYRDDGEMQCHECGLDFKRDPVERIVEVFEKCKVVITGKVIYPNDIGQHPADCQCTACWKRRAYL
jgi:hypothetical protein